MAIAWPLHVDRGSGRVGGPSPVLVEGGGKARQVIGWISRRAGRPLCDPNGQRGTKELQTAMADCKEEAIGAENDWVWSWELAKLHGWT